MGQPTSNSPEEINRTRILIIKWPDEVCTFVNELYDASTGILTIIYSFIDGTPGKQPHKNSYKLDSFDTSIGVVKNVVFRQKKGAGPKSIKLPNPIA